MRQKVKQADIQRALRGARAAGFDPKELRVGSDGEIRVILADLPADADASVRDEIAGWAKKHGARP